MPIFIKTLVTNKEFIAGVFSCASFVLSGITQAEEAKIRKQEREEFMDELVERLTIDY